MLGNQLFWESLPFTFTISPREQCYVLHILEPWLNVNILQLRGSKEISLSCMNIPQQVSHQLIMRSCGNTS